MHFLHRLNYKLIAISALALSLISMLAIDALTDFIGLQQLAAIQFRDARQGALNAQFDVGIVHAAGEAASYTVTRREGYLDEAKKAVERAGLALQGLRETLTSPVPANGLESKHESFLKRQVELLSLVKQGVEAAHNLTSGADGVSLNAALNKVYAYEPEAERLRQEVSAHREQEYAANEVAISLRSRHTLSDFVGCLLLFIVFTGVLLSFARRSIVTPLDRLAMAADAVAKGDLRQVVTVTSRDEIGHLQHAFNGMVSNLRGQRAALIESESGFRQMADHFPGAFWMQDANTATLTYVSPGYETIWGLSRAAMYKHPDSFLQTVHLADRDRLRHLIAADAHTQLGLEYRLLLPDSSIRWIWHRRFAIKQADGSVQRRVDVAEDITTRKLAEQELTMVLEEREQMNRDLHDDVLQSIYAVGLVLESARHGLAQDRANAATRVDQAIAQLNDIMARMRSYIISPSIASGDEEDLATALQSLVNTVRSPHTPPLQLDHHD